MICNTIIDEIPNLVRKEINTNDRIIMIDHLKTCNQCRHEYLNQLKMFYLLDKSLVNETIPLDRSKFHEDLESKFSTSDPSKKLRNFKWYGYAIAAVLLVFIVSLIFITNNQKSNKIVSESSIIDKALHNEDWISLQRILKSDYEIKKRADEKISLSLLIEKLEILEKQGIRSIDYIDLFNEVNNVQNFYSSSNQDTELNQIQVNKLVQTLESYKSSKSEITLYEIGLFLAEINKGGTKS